MQVLNNIHKAVTIIVASIIIWLLSCVYGPCNLCQQILK